MQSALILRHPVYAPGGQVLFAEGTMLTDGVIADLIHGAQNQSWVQAKVMEHGSIAGNLHKLCATPPYDRIFSNGSRTRSLFAFLGKAQLPEPLLSIIDFFKRKDPYTYRHILIVFALSMLLAQDFMKDIHDLQAAAQASTTHDLGKFCIPLEVLKKTTLLGQAERQYLEHHSAAGYVLLSYFLKDPRHPAAITARDHHERCDGSGYPCGQKLENRIVQIVAVSDVFDALIANRPYRSAAYDLRSALDEITEMAATGAIPWDIAKALINYSRRRRVPIGQCQVSREKRGHPPANNLYRGVAPTDSCFDIDAES